MKIEFMICGLISALVLMVIIQASRYFEHAKKHDKDAVDSVDYNLAHTPSGIYWVIPLIFVVMAACMGALVSELIYADPLDMVEKEGFKLSSEWSYIIPCTVAMLAYLMVDKNKTGLVSRICNAFYYVLNESKPHSKGELMKKLIEEFKKAAIEDEKELKKYSEVTEEDKKEEVKNE